MNAVMELIYFFHYESNYTKGIKIICELLFRAVCSEQNLKLTVLFLCDFFFFLLETDLFCYSIVLPCSYCEMYEVRIVGVYNCLFTAIVLEDETVISKYKLFFRTCIFQNDWLVLLI